MGIQRRRGPLHNPILLEHLNFSEDGRVLDVEWKSARRCCYECCEDLDIFSDLSASMYIFIAQVATSLVSFPRMA